MAGAAGVCLCKHSGQGSADPPGVQTQAHNMVGMARLSHMQPQVPMSVPPSLWDPAPGWWVAELCPCPSVYPHMHTCSNNSERWGK